MKPKRKRWVHARLYGVWSHMMKRCYNPAVPKYADYGGRGIRVCERWHTWRNFFADMHPRPDGFTLDRIDNDGPYSPENCRWVDWFTQNQQRPWARYIEFNGERMCLSDWARKLGMDFNTLHERIQRGWPIEKALTIPVSASNSSLRLRTKEGGKRPKIKRREQRVSDNASEST